MSSPPRILVVDDDQRMAESIRLLLERQQYEIATVHNGRDALEALDAGPPDAVLLDVIMPEVDGFKVLDLMRARHPEIPVIIMTGFVTVDSALSALKGGAYDYLRKPFEYEELVCTVQNALDQERLKAQTRRLTGMLEHSQRKYRHLVENSPDVIYTLNPQGEFTFINSAVERLLGYQPPDLLGRSFLDIVWDEDREEAYRLLNLQNGCRTPGLERRLRFKPFRNGDSPRYFEIRCASGESNDSEHKENQDSESVHDTGSIHWVARDITYRKQLESQLQQAQRMESIGAMAGGLAHNFNNILMSIQANLSLLSLNAHPMDPSSQRIQSIEEQVRSAKELTGQLLGLARKRSPNLKPGDLNELVRRTCRMFASAKKEIEIFESYEPSLSPVNIDAGQMEQVLLNLYVNAWHAMPGGGSLYLKTRNVILDSMQGGSRGLKPGAYVHLSVQDTGVGMDEATRSRIFEPFFTTKDPDRGTGLGLTSAYRTIQNHSGFIEVTSRQGEGSTFNLYLPASTDTVAGKEPLSARILRGRETVLLIDDEEMIIRAGEEMLRALGYQVLPARGGEEGLEIYRRRGREIDLVILDMIMPKMNGRETFNHLKNIEPGLRVLIASGGCTDEEMQELFSKGCNGFIQKPFDLCAFSQKLRDILDS